MHTITIILLIILEDLSQFHAVALIIIAHMRNYRDFCPRDLSKITAEKANRLFHSLYASVKIF